MYAGNYEEKAESGPLAVGSNAQALAHSPPVSIPPPGPRATGGHTPQLSSPLLSCRLPGSPTWFKSEKNCWTHFAPVVAFFELFEALRGYLGGAMVAKNLLSVAEADEVVAEARRAADRGPGWRELRKRAKGF